MRCGPAKCWCKRGVRTKEKEGELSAARRLIVDVPVRGRVLTGDALYCQRDLCATIVERQGDYLFRVKDNQHELLDDLNTVFTNPPPGEVMPTATQRSRHGDRQESRVLTATTVLNGYLRWPGLGQVFRIVTTVHRGQSVTSVTTYGITSLGPTTPAATLLSLARGHWGIETRLHYVRDVTLGEDASQIRTGNAPQNLAALRNSVIGLLRGNAKTNIAGAIRDIGWRPGAALAFLGIAVGGN